MRITNNMLINNMLSSLSDNLSRTAKLQLQQATGKKISKPSDDPIVASKSLKLRTDVAEIAQYKRNTEDATSWMEISESTIGQLGQVMQRVRELTVQGANGTNTPADMQKIAVEVEQLKKQATHLANATYAGRYVFSGYKTDKPLMDDNGNFLLNVGMGEDIKYEIGIGDNININVAGGDLFNKGVATSGNTAGTSMGTGAMTFPVTITAGVNDGLNLTVDGEAVGVTIPAGTYTDPFVFLSVTQNTINASTTTAADVTASFSAGRLMLTSGVNGVGSSVVVNTATSTAAIDLGMATVTETAGVTGTKGSMMQMFDDLLAGLTTGNHAAISALLSTVDVEVENMLRVRSGVGARMNRLELTANRLDDDNTGFTKLMSQNEDVDIEETAMNLMNENLVYQASLATGAKVIQPTLVNYLS